MTASKKKKTKKVCKTSRRFRTLVVCGKKKKKIIWAGGKILKRKPRRNIKKITRAVQKVSVVFFIFALAMNLFIFNLPAPVRGQAADNYRWVEHPDGMSAMYIVGMAVDPTDGNTVYALTSGQGIYKSTDAGANWSAANTGFPDDKTVAWSSMAGDLLTIDPNNHSTLYTNINGVVYKTTDGGANWATANNGINFSLDIDAIAGVIIDSTNSNHLYAASIASGESGGIFESTDAAANWTQIAGWAYDGSTLGGESYNDAWPLNLDPSDPDKMYFSSVYEENYRSTDAGANWTAMALPETILSARGSGTAVAVHPASHAVFIGTNAGMAKSTDYGATWTEITTFSGLRIASIKFAPSDATVGYTATTDGKIYKTADSGDTWTLQSTNGDYTWWTMDVHPTDANTIYIGSSGAGIFKSTDGGGTVTQKITGLPSSIRINGLDFSVSNPNVFYAGVHGVGIYKSTDSGYSWSKMSTHSSTGKVTVDISDPATMFFDSGGKIYKSTDSGVTASEVLSVSGGYLYAPEADPNNHQIFYAMDLLHYQLYKSSSGGDADTWSLLSNFAPASYPYAIAVDPTNSNNVYVATYDYFWKSIDGGDNWTRVTDGLSEDSVLVDLAIDRNNPDVIYAAGLFTGHILKSTNGGDTWSTVFTAPGDEVTRQVARVVVDRANSNNVYVFGFYGWWKSTDAGQTWGTALSTTGLSAAPYSFGYKKTFQDPNNASRFLVGSTSQGVVAWENSIPDFSTSTLTMVKHAGGTVYSPGDVLDFTYTLINSGLAQATDPQVAITLPSSLTYVADSTTKDGATLSPDPISGATLTVPVQDLNYGDSMVITFQAVINDDVVHNTVVSFSGQVTSNEDTGGTTAGTVSFTTTDIIAPTLAEVTAVVTPTADTTPDYTFSTTEAGTISYQGSCSSATTTATAGDNTIAFSELSDGTYSDCQVRVTDIAGNPSSWLSVTSFTISHNTQPPPYIPPVNPPPPETPPTTPVTPPSQTETPPPSPTITPPAAPLSAAPQNITTTSLQWCFIDNAGNETGFILYNNLGNTLASAAASSGTGQTICLTESNLAPGQALSGRSVRAFNSGGQSSATQLPAAYLLPIAPAAPTLKAVDKNKVNVLINPGSNSADTQYAIFETTTKQWVSTAGLLGQNIVYQTKADWGGENGTTVFGLTQETSYEFKIKGKNGAGVETDFSPTAMVKTLKAPPFLTVSLLGTLTTRTVDQELRVGDVLEFTAVVKNQGEGNATQVSLESPLPAGVEEVAGLVTINGQKQNESVKNGVLQIPIGEVASKNQKIVVWRSRVTNTIIGVKTAAFRAWLAAAEVASPVSSETVSFNVYVPPPSIPACADGIDNDKDGWIDYPQDPGCQSADGISEEPYNIGCGNKICEKGETYKNCSSDCATICGNGICESPKETSASCSKDCPVLPICGNAICEKGETSANCLKDCPLPVKETKIPGEEKTNEPTQEEQATTSETGEKTSVKLTPSEAVGGNADFANRLEIPSSTLLPGLSTSNKTVTPNFLQASKPSPVLKVAGAATVSSTGQIFTNTTKPEISGRFGSDVLKGTSVKISINGKVWGLTPIQDDQGNFIFNMPQGLPDGDYVVTAFIDENHEATFKITIDTIPPKQAVVQAAQVKKMEYETQEFTPQSGVVTMEFSGNINEADWAKGIKEGKLIIHSQTVEETFVPQSPSWHYTAKVALDFGQHAAAVVFTDLAGNVSVPSAPWFFDVNPPLTTQIAAQITGQPQVAEIIKTIAPVAEPVVQAIKPVAVVLDKQVINNPKVEKANETVVAPVVVTAIAVNTMAAVPRLSLLQYLQMLLQYLQVLIFQPLLLLSRARRKGWGVVYNSLTKTPVDLAVVRVIEHQSNRIVQTRVTDKLGRFIFIVSKPGVYRLEVAHLNYVFPSVYLRNQTIDQERTNLYLGQPFEVKNKGEVVAFNIPMDRQEVSAEKILQSLIAARRKKRLQKSFSMSGFVFSLVSFVISPTYFIFALIVAHVLLYQIFKRLSLGHKPKSWGVVSDKQTGQPIDLALVRIFDAEYKKLLETQISDSHGRYFFLVGKSKYYLTFEKPGYEPRQTEVLDLTLPGKETVVGLNAALEKKTDLPQVGQ